MDLKREIIVKLGLMDMDVFRFVDISGLSYEENKGFCTAVLIGKGLSVSFIKKMIEDNQYWNTLKTKGELDDFHQKELEVGVVADKIATYLKDIGCSSYSQSDHNILSNGHYNASTKTTPLPHKTIALLSGIGWIGKNNLLVTPEYGSAISICSVLTDATIDYDLVNTKLSSCGNCTLCRDVCEPKALSGDLWTLEKGRDEILDVHNCSTCLKCMIHCPWTKRYMRRNT